jgi:hypothetical protein
MIDAKQIDKPVPAKTLIVDIPHFFAKVNDFDIKAVQDTAKACKV